MRKPIHGETAFAREHGLDIFIDRERRAALWVDEFAAFNLFAGS